MRITPHGDGQVALGCSFESALTGADAVRTGLAAAEAEHPEAAAKALSHEPRPGRPISIVLFAAGGKVAGPYALGRVRTAGERAVDVALEDSVEALLESLADGPVRAARARRFASAHRRMQQGRGGPNFPFAFQER